MVKACSVSFQNTSLSSGAFKINTSCALRQFSDTNPNKQRMVNGETHLKSTPWCAQQCCSGSSLHGLDQPSHRTIWPQGYHQVGLEVSNPHSSQQPTGHLPHTAYFANLQQVLFSGLVLRVLSTIFYLLVFGCLGFCFGWVFVGFSFRVFFLISFGF